MSVTGSSLRLLIVDDLPEVATVISRMLRRFETVIAHSGNEALELLENDMVDFVFSDIMMPGMSGVEFYLAATERYPELSDRFAFVTGGVFAEVDLSPLISMKRPIINKPVRRQQLLEVLHEVSPMPISPMTDPPITDPVVD